MQRYSTGGAVGAAKTAAAVGRREQLSTLIDVAAIDRVDRAVLGAALGVAAAEGAVGAAGESAIACSTTAAGASQSSVES